MITNLKVEVPQSAPRRAGTKFVSYYSTTEAPASFLQVEHRSEEAARKGSWQSAAMKAVWHYRGYVAL